MNRLRASVLRLCEDSAWFQKIACFMITSWALGIILYKQEQFPKLNFGFHIVSDN
jgi:hypothetical protein